MAKYTTQVLEIDIQGYRQTLQNKGKPRILVEGLSNAFDTHTDVVLVTFAQKDGWADLVIKDNDPDGFTNLKDAWTLFAASNRREDPEARGRFGQGEKELIAIAVDGGLLSITSTKGSVRFTKAGRVEEAAKTPHGTILEARLKLNKTEAAEFVTLMRAIIVPKGVVFKFNDEIIERTEPVRTTQETLDTVIWDAEGNMRDTRRLTSVELFEAAGNRPYIYELGIPVVEHDGRFHINVGQKVPLNSARDNVKPAYLRKLREIMLNSTFDLLTSVDQKSTWVKDVVAIATDEAFDSVMVGTYGKDAVIADPSNWEATKRAVDQNRTIIHSRSLSGDIRDRIRERETFKPAGQVIQTQVPTSPDGIPPIPVEQWTEGMHAVAGYVQEVGHFILGYKPDVKFMPTNCGTGGKRYPASWSDGTVTFYLRHLGKGWPDGVDQETLDALIIHEFTHATADDHFTDRFIHDIATIGASMRSCPTQLEQYRGGEK
jgi:hypothetical protein